jgi:hypothetical protein
MKFAHLSLLLTLPVSALHAQSTINPTKAFAYAPNAGWLNFLPTATDGVKVSEFSLSGKIYASNLAGSISAMTP